MERNTLTGRHSIELVDTLSLSKRHSQCQLIIEKNAQSVFQSFFDSEIDSSNKEYINIALRINSPWCIENLKRFLKYKHKCNLYILSRGKHGYCSYPSLHDFSNLEDNSLFFENIVAIVIIFDNKKENKKGIKRKIRRYLNDKQNEGEPYPSV